MCGAPKCRQCILAFARIVMVPAATQPRPTHAVMRRWLTCSTRRRGAASANAVLKSRSRASLYAPRNKARITPTIRGEVAG